MGWEDGFSRGERFEGQAYEVVLCVKVLPSERVIICVKV